MNNVTIEEVKSDRRTRKTRKAIKSAIMNLIVKKEISKITIKEISELADINRKTFYTHYQDIYAVIDELESDLIEKVFKVLDDNDIAKMVYNPYQLYRQLTELITEDIDFYALLVNATVFDSMLNKIKKNLGVRLVSVFMDKTTVNAVMLNYIIDFVVAGLIASYREWFNSDRQVPLEELSKQISLIVSNGVVSIVKELPHNEGKENQCD